MSNGEIKPRVTFSVDPGFNNTSLHHNRNIDSNVIEVPGIV